MYYILCNPTAGGGRAMEALKALESHLTKLGVRYEVGLSKYHRHAMELVAQAVEGGHRAILTLGGDGTVFEAVNGLAATGKMGEVALGFLPGGTGNDFTRSLGLPRDPVAAFDALHTGGRARIDLWKANDLYFCNVFGLGLDVDLGTWAARTKKILSGMPAYIAALFLTLFGFRFKKIRLTADGQTMERQVTVLTASNGRYYGAGIDVAPSASLDDGRLDIVFINKVFKPKVPFLLAKYIAGRHIKEVRECETLRAQTLTVESDMDFLCETDGEYLLRPPVTVSRAPFRLLALVPATYPQKET